MIYYESGAMAREEKLERLKEIEKVLTTKLDYIYIEDRLCYKCIYCEEFFSERNIRHQELHREALKQEANKIGEELIGCGKDFEFSTGVSARCGKYGFVKIKDNIDDIGTGKCFCPTCQEAEERVVRINGR